MFSSMRSRHSKRRSIQAEENGRSTCHSKGVGGKGSSSSVQKIVARAIMANDFFLPAR